MSELNPESAQQRAKRREPESAQEQIAQTIEIKAGKEFGPKKLTKSDVARALNIGEEDFSKKEWADISEFAVNAGTELIRTAVEKRLSENPTNTETKTIRKDIKGNRYNFIPYHDLFHAAETYRVQHSEKANAAFVEVDALDRYTDPKIIVAELYPLLFFAPPVMSAPLPVLLCSSEGRADVTHFFTKEVGLPLKIKENIKTLLSGPAPLTPEEREDEYKRLIEEAIVGNAVATLFLDPEETTELREGVERAFANPPQHYIDFASKVFNQEWSENPRLFLDELLAAIRTQPEPETEEKSTNPS
jgi:hypothetical protein